MDRRSSYRSSSYGGYSSSTSVSSSTVSRSYSGMPGTNHDDIELVNAGHGGEGTEVGGQGSGTCQAGAGLVLR